MKNKIIKRLLPLGLAIGLALTSFCGCGAKKESSNEASTEQVVSGKHINVAFFWISTGLDPAVDYDGWVLSRLGVGESLVKLNDNLEVEASIADEWKNIDDLTWEFHIRDGLTFSNGKVVTAKEAKDAILRAVEKNNRAAEYLKIDEIICDGQTMTIKTTEPNAALLNNIVEPVFNIIDVSEGEEKINNAPVGTGPFVVADFKSEQSVELVKNEKYWGGEVGLDSVSVTQIADASARAMALQSKEIDLTNTIDNTTTNKTFLNNEDYNVSSIVSPRVNVAYMNNDKSRPLGDIELRKAVSYAADRESYANLIGGSAAHSAYSDATPFKNETINAISYDVKKAEEILDAAGYKDTDNDGYREMPNGSKMVLQFLQSADHGSADSAILAQALQADLKKVGINLEILAVENLSDYQTEGNFDFYTANDNSAPTGDPQIWLETMYTGLGTSGKKNLTKFENEEINNIVNDMKKTFDTQARFELAAKASQVLNDEASNLFLTNSYINMVSLAKVKNANQPVCDFYFLTKDITVE